MSQDKPLTTPESHPITAQEYAKIQAVLATVDGLRKAIMAVFLTSDEISNVGTNFVDALESAARAARRDCQTMLEQMHPNYLGEGERTYVGMVYFHLRNKLGEPSSQNISLEFNRKYPKTGGGFADLAFGEGGIWRVDNRGERIFVEAKPIWDGLSRRQKDDIFEDISKLSRMQRKYHPSSAYILLPFLGRKKETDLSRQSRANLDKVLRRAEKKGIKPILLGN